MKHRFFTPILLTALILGLVMRGWQIRERFMYSHDNDLASWIVKDVIIDHHPRLIGQETSAKGIFIGPLWYYSLIPFYLLTGMDPIGSVFHSLLISILGILSFYFVTDRLFGRRPAGIAAIIYAVSQLISNTEREVVPTTPVMLWTIWFFYAINLIFQGKKSGILLSAILLGLVWHLNLALILLSPLVVIGVWWRRNTFKLSDLKIPLSALLLVSLPLLLFEFRHGFIQTLALLNSLTSINSDSGTSFVLVDKISRVFLYAFRNATKIFFIPSGVFPEKLIPISLSIIFILLLAFRKIQRYLGLVFILWMGLYVIFFTLHPINLSEYYLNGMNVFWIVIASVILGKFLPKVISSTLLTILVAYNLSGFLSSPINASGYIQRGEIINFIKRDSIVHNYPCVSLSFITSPGSNLGYRYFTYLSTLKTKPVSDQVPVYTIVFPHSLVDRFDKSFGALALIYPDYSRYDQSRIQLACQGENSNLTQPMFGFTN